MNALLKKACGMVAVLAVAGWGSEAMACATCYGASDSPLAEGMNWGIFSLLGVIGSVLAGVGAFFVHIGRRSSRLRAEDFQPQHDQHS